MAGSPGGFAEKTFYQCGGYDRGSDYRNLHGSPAGWRGFFETDALMRFRSVPLFFVPVPNCFPEKIQDIRGRGDLDSYLKKYWEIGVTEDNGEMKQLIIPAQDGVRKGKAYRFYYKNDDLLGVEEL